MFDDFPPFILVSLGAVIGAYLRFYLTHKLRVFVPKPSTATLLVNLLATFSLGYFYGLNDHSSIFYKSSNAYLLIGVGFLGSLSTFSTLILDILNSFYRNNTGWLKAIFLAFNSIFFGLLVAFLGFSLANE